MKKRLDIQGLRALAIAFVVLYHADLSFAGGFTGVDVFFVISGFVIAGTLLKELDKTGRLSLSGFYARRVRRILPAPAVMLVFVALAGIMLDPAGTQRMAAMTGISASTLFANFYLVTLRTGYFDVSTQLNPLLHTWMLSVIAQIYIVFPLVLLAGWRLGRSRLGRGRGREWAFAVVALASALSFLLSLSLSHGYFQDGGRVHPKLVFYSSPTRAWEFGLGALLMLAMPLLERIPARLAIALDLAGAAALGLSAFLVQQVGFTEISALLPVGGACLLIAAGTRAPFGVSRLLSLRPMVWFGDLSYSVYLWHWPLIVFAKALWPTVGWAVPVAAGVSLLPAWLTYRFVENPIRFRARAGSRSTVALRGAVALAAVCIAVPIAANLGLLRAQEALSSTKAMTSWRKVERLHLDHRKRCASGATLGSAKNAHCVWRVQRARGDVVLFGDSNAGQLAEPVIQAGNRAGYNVRLATYTSCPFMKVRLKRIDGESKLCPRFAAESLDYIVRAKPSLVVLASRTDFYLQNPVDGLGFIGGSLTFSNSGKARIWRQVLHSTLLRLSAAGVPVLLVQPIPVLPLDPATCAVVRVLLGKCSSSLPRSAVDKWLRLAIRTNRAGARGVEGAWLLDFENELCEKNRCTTVKNGISLYRDSRHLSVDGALTLSGKFQRAIVAHAKPR
ncbi:MAG: acyltransferase family protein [Gaiellaceae bacterium]